MQPNYARTRHACYFEYVAMAAVFSLPPILFMTFREMYGISYTLLGTLVLINFCTQLGVDLLFTFFGKYFDPHKVLRITPLVTSAGLVTYALVPLFFPQNAYTGLVIGTFVFSVAAGLSEVLVSPTVAALPSDTPEKDMANLHSLYGYGVVMVVAVSTVFLKLFGVHNWNWLVLLFAVLPVIASILLFTSPLPVMELTHAPGEKGGAKRSTGILLCLVCIFFGSAAENGMTNWVSSYLEAALRIPKAVGDILGLALFAVLLALTRTVYAKYGRNIYNVLLASMAGAVVCYLVAGLSPVPVISMIACVVTGICTSMLWPGTLILMEEKIPNPGVAAYALMAAGGDFGASVAPQGIGIIVDAVAVSDWAGPISQQMAVSPEQLGMKIAIVLTAVFPIIGVAVLLYMGKYFARQGK